MSYRGNRNWPPEWTTTRQSDDELPKGEVGILKGVFMNDDSNSEVMLIIEHEGHQYMGNLRFEDPWFCSQVYSLLQLHVERSITDIGNIDLP
jgi:hypothetical protein